MEDTCPFVDLAGVHALRGTTCDDQQQLHVTMVQQLRSGQDHAALLSHSSLQGIMPSQSCSSLAPWIMHGILIPQGLWAPMWALLVIPYATSTKLRIWVLPLAAGPVVGTPTALERRSSAKRLRPDSEPAQEEVPQPEIPAKGALAPATPLPTPPSSGQARYDGPATQRASSAQTRLTFTEEASVAEVEDEERDPRVVVTLQVVHDPTMGTPPAGTLRPPSLPPELWPPEHSPRAGASRQDQRARLVGEPPSRSVAGSSQQASAAREARESDDAAASLAVSAEATELRPAEPGSVAEAAAERLMSAARGKGRRPQKPLPLSAAVPASPFALPADAEVGAAPGAAVPSEEAAATGKGEAGPSAVAPPAVAVHRAAPPPPPPPPPPAGATWLCST